MSSPHYRIRTWDIELQRFTPQRGVRSGPYTLFGLRKALRKLRQMGYEVSRRGGFSVLVERVESKS